MLSFNVLYHGDPGIVRTAIGEIRRVLKPGGIFQGTMLSKRNAGFGVGTEVAPDTFIRDAGDDMDDSDKVHPHFYCDAAGLVALYDWLRAPQPPRRGAQDTGLVALASRGGAEVGTNTNLADAATSTNLLDMKTEERLLAGV